MFRIIPFLLFFRLFSLLLQAQSPILNTRIIPSPGEIYTYKFIKSPTSIDTSIIGENILWDFSRLKDTATYYEEVYQESTPSQNEIFEDSYSLDSNSIQSDLLIWVNYFDSTKYYRMGAYEKPTAPMSYQPYIYDDTIMLFKFPFSFNESMYDTYSFIKGGRRHHKNQYVQVHMKYDAYGILILPNNDSCYQAIRIRREEKYYNMVNDTPQLVGTKLYFYWYSAIQQNYFIKLVYANGTPLEAWFQKKKSFIKKKRN